MRVPGSFRSPLWNLNELKDGKVVAPADTWSYVGLAEDARLFVPGRVAPYAVKPDPYDGDAFHNW